MTRRKTGAIAAVLATLAVVAAITAVTASAATKPPIVIGNAPVADDGVAVRNTDALADQAAQN